MFIIILINSGHEAKESQKKTLITLQGKTYPREEKTEVSASGTGGMQHIISGNPKKPDCGNPIHLVPWRDPNRGPRWVNVKGEQR